MDERQILDDLERQSMPRGYDSSSSDMINAEQVIDLSGVRENVAWTEGKYPFRIMDVEYKVSKERIDERTGRPAGGQPYLLLKLLCFAGPCAGDEMEDRVMLEGKALSRFLNLIRACGLYDEVNKRFVGRHADLINQEVWGTVVNRDETYKGEKRVRSGIAFTGYEAITKYELPAENDPFTEAGDVAPDLEAPAPARMPDPKPRVEAVATEETLPVEEAVFVDEETGEILSEAAEPEPEPVRPAARPAPRPAARAAGDKPPF